MNRLVYLHELDSTRNSVEEIIHGHKTMIYEILYNGNMIVLSYNQIVESNALVWMIMDDDYFDILKHFIQSGYIKFSQQYVDNKLISSPSHYFRYRLGQDNSIFSALPIKTHKSVKLKQILLEAVTDLNLLKLNEIEKEDLRLFYNRFIYMITLLSLEKNAIIPAKKLGNNTHKIYGDLERTTTFLSMIMVYCEEKPENKVKKFNDLLVTKYNEFYTQKYIREIKNKNLCDKLYLIFNKNSKKPENDHNSSFNKFETNFYDAINILEDLKKNKDFENKNSRSLWYLWLEESKFNNDVMMMLYCLIDVAYNYEKEICISYTSKHYSINKQNKYQNSFCSDFINRLVIYWDTFESGVHDYYTNKKTPIDIKKIDTIHYWKALKNIIPIKSNILIGEVSKKSSGKFYAENKNVLDKEKKIRGKELSIGYKAFIINTCFIIYTFFLNDFLLNNFINPLLSFLFENSFLIKYVYTLSLLQEVLAFAFTGIIIILLKNIKKEKNYNRLILLVLLLLSIAVFAFSNLTLLIMLMSFYFSLFISLSFYLILNSLVIKIFHLEDIIPTIHRFVVYLYSLNVLRKLKKHNQYEVTIACNDLNK